MVFETLLFGSTLYAGAKTYQQLKAKGYWPLRQGWFAPRSIASPVQVAPVAEHPDVEKANQMVVVAVAGMGLTVAATLLSAPLLSLTSLPLMAYIFAPTFQAAYTTAVKERRINNAVMDATRITLCVILRYDFVTALNACLQAGSQKLFVQAEADFQHQLQSLFGTEQATAWRLTSDVEVHPPLTAIEPLIDTLTQTGERKSWVQQIGEASADRMAPWMFASFVISLPVLGPNHAAAFLTTGFGAHLRTLGPYTIRNFLIPAAQEGIVIKDAHVLEAANLVNTLVIDQRVLTNPAARASARATIQTLRNRTVPQSGATHHPFAAYVIVNPGEEEAARTLVADLGLDDYLPGLTMGDRAAQLEQLTMNGRWICYVGVGEDDQEVMAKALVSVVWPGTATGPTTGLTTGPTTGPTTGAQVLLLTCELQALVRFFDLATTFTAKQSFNLLAPIGLDLVDIGTTLFLHWDLGYSVLFTYSGLLFGAINGRRRQPRLSPIANRVPEQASALPLLGALDPAVAGS